MTALTLATLSREAPRLMAIARFFADVFAGIREAREMQQRYETLSRLSDAALARRGLTRADIPHAAVTGRIGR
jgi:uncharacterized protein YjiS (DUF1127 family)